MNANERDKQQGQKGPEGQRGQQQGGQQQAQGGQGQQYGEGNYKASRDYNEGLKEHMQSHDIEKEARAAAPKSPEEQREMDEAERIGKSRAKAKDDDMGDPNGGEPKVN
jgi:hypothetical protein